MPTKRGEGAAAEIVPDTKCPFCQRLMFRKLKVPKQFRMIWYCFGCEKRANNCLCIPLAQSVSMIEASLNSASSPSALIAAVERLECEISECEDLEKDYTNRSTGGGGEVQVRRIQRKRSLGWRMPPNTKYVGRANGIAGFWGNPFKVIHETDKWRGYSGWAVYLRGDLVRGYYDSEEKAASAACEEYRAEIVSHRRPAPVSVIKAELGGKNLSCWCPLDQPCHADLLLELANA